MFRTQFSLRLTTLSPSYRNREQSRARPAHRDETPSKEYTAEYMGRMWVRALREGGSAEDGVEEMKHSKKGAVREGAEVARKVDREMFGVL